MKPTLHLLGLFHTQSTLAFSHCAFTGKALRFPKMMQMRGYKVVEYSNEGSESTADEKVVILTKDEFDGFFNSRKPTDFHGDDAYVGSPAHQLFEQRLVKELRERVQPQDIICHPFGHAHQLLLSEFPDQQHVETGIGYPTLMPDSFRIFESYAWMHFHQGREGRNGINYEWVIPNYFDIDEWEPSYDEGKYIAFLGRICPIKGMDTVLEIARRSIYPVKIAGQGDPTPWQHPNIEYVGPLTGRQRSDFLRNARCAVMPTVFTEPFGGSGVEAMLCGTPLIAVDYGAFTETVAHGVTGYRCKTLNDWIEAVNNAGNLNRKLIADYTRQRYSLEACAEKYDKVFTTINQLYRKGWYSCDDDREIFHSTLKSYQDEEKTVVVVGAMDGVTHDDLAPYLLKNEKWKGVLIEPVPYYFEKLVKNYSHLPNMSFENVAIAAKREMRPMYCVDREAIESGEVPAWCDGISTFHPEFGAITQGDILAKTVLTSVECVRFRDIVEKHNLRKIDILQIDTEGSDIAIFRQIWDAGFRPSLIHIEIVWAGEKDLDWLRTLLLSQKYQIERVGDNWVAVRQEGQE